MTEQCINVSSDSLAEERPLPDQARVCHIVVLVLCVLAMLGSFLLYPRDGRLYLFGVQWPVNCALFRNFGVKCALCGLTRSFSCIAKGDFSEAIRFHPLGPAVFVFICLQGAYRIRALCMAGRDSRKLSLAGTYFALAVAGALFANWFVYIGGLVL